METTLNWGKLIATGQAKAIGVPWTPDEHKAVLSGIPVDYVRIGILTQGDYEERLIEEAKEEKKTGELPLIKRNKEDLLMLAHQLGIPALSIASKELLVTLIEEKKFRKKPETKLKGRRKK